MARSVARCLVVALLLLLAVMPLATVTAAGGPPGDVAEWQVNWSRACVSDCGHFANTSHTRLFADGSGVAERTNVGMPSASHEKWEIGTWYIGENGRFWVDNVTICPIDIHTCFPLSDAFPMPLDTGIIAVPGHYDTTYVWGENAPLGASFTMQVIHRD